MNIEKEPLLIPDDSRLSVLPIQYHDLYGLYLKQVDCFWRPEEIDLSKDLYDWTTLDKNEKHFISLILAFFNQMDCLIGENIGMRFYTEVQNAEARLFYGFQLAMEGIHSITYSNLIDTYIQDSTEKNRLFNAIQNYDCVKRKADWVRKHIESSSSFSQRLVAFICVEGIHFSGAFCAIYWFKQRNKLAGLCFSNELISRDEALHAEFGIALYHKLKNKLSQECIHNIVKEAVKIETNFICEALPCRLIGMNSVLMTQYIQFVADRLCLQLGIEKIYGASNPFSFMELISIERKTNFFEARISEYALANKKMEGDCFSFSAEF